MAQTPMISIPRKTTDEVDWTTPIRNLIAQSYGENPDNYAAECTALQRCRQDAVRGAGSDFTARDLLYKYFGQLELLELRFPEIRVTFPWHDAFTTKLITQTSIAYEKASVLFQIAATHSSIATSQSRSDPEGLKRAFNYFRTCAGMLNYINENFLHAPSTDLSRDVIKFLSSIALAQASEVFFEKCTDEKKGNALVAKVGSQVASMYTTLSEEVKEFMGKGIFDRNWVTLIQIKAKYFSSLAQYYRGLADNTTGKHGDALVRFNLADSLAKEAAKLAASFSSSFVPTMSPTLPADAGPSMQERTKAHSVLCTERKNEAQRENDLIYNAILPPAEALPPIEKTSVATAITIQEVYGNPDVQKTIGQDFFIRLIPLSVHESASVYSEEKAKLVRAEVEKAEGADGEVRSALDAMGVREGLVRFKAMAEGHVEGQDEIPVEVRRWKEDISVMESMEGVDAMLRQLGKLKESVQKELENVSRQLEIESRDCEEQRVKYDHKWTQEPSAGPSKQFRQDLKSHFGALEAAAPSDEQVAALWNAVQGDIRLLLNPDLEAVFRERAGEGEHLLDLDAGNEADEAEERAKIGGYVEQIEDRLVRLNKIAKERSETLKDLKEKIQADDVSHLLLLNRRNSGVEPTLFAAELEKFRPYQQRIGAAIHHQEVTLQEVASLWKGLKEHAGRGPGAKKWEEREKKKKDIVRRFSNARDRYMEVRDGLAKGLKFYTELTDLTTKLSSNVRGFVASRTVERNALVAKLETEKRLSVSSPPTPAAKPPLPPPPPASSLDSAFSSMKLGPTSSAPTPLPPPSAPQSYGVASPPYGQAYGTAPQQPAGSAPRYLPSPPSRPPQSYETTPQQPYGNAAHSQYGAPSQALYAQQQQQLPTPPLSQPSSYLPPPPRSAYSAPSVDPYASLSVFDAPKGQSTGPASIGLPPPPPPPQSSYMQHSSYQTPYLQSPPPPPSQPPYNPYQQQQQQHHRQGSFGHPGLPPPPPPAAGYGYGGTSPPPPLQHVNSFQTMPPPPPQPSQGGYSQSYSYGQ